LRHTFATEALAAGVSTFELARVIGTSIAMIDRHYGHLARGLLGLDQGAAGRQIESFWRFSGVRRRAVGHRRLAAIPHEDGDHGRWSVPGSNRRPPAVTFGLA
jgi:hypothetical protein